MTKLSHFCATASVLCQNIFTFYINGAHIIFADFFIQHITHFFLNNCYHFIQLHNRVFKNIYWRSIMCQAPWKYQRSKDSFNLFERYWTKKWGWSGRENGVKRSCFVLFFNSKHKKKKYIIVCWWEWCSREKNWWGRRETGICWRDILG